MTVVFLLGGNQDNTIGILNKATLEIELQIGSINKKSSYYESEAWGFKHTSNFINQVLICETELSAEQCLQTILEIEKKLGRIRNQNTPQYSARTIDIDILFYEQQIINTEILTIPHPRLHLRMFTLVPLAEIASQYLHPIFNKNCKELLAECTDTLTVLKI